MKSKILFGLFALLNRIFTDLCKPWLFKVEDLGIESEAILINRLENDSIGSVSC